MSESDGATSGPTSRRPRRRAGNRGFWKTLPGIVTATAGLISAIAALIGGLIAAGFITVPHPKTTLDTSSHTGQSFSGSSSSGGSSGGSSGASVLNGGSSGSGGGSGGNFSGGGNTSGGGTTSGDSSTGGNTGGGTTSGGTTGRGTTGGGRSTGGSGGGNVGGGSSGPVISGVSFTGNTAAPTVTVSGQGFGTSPTGQLNNSTSCGSYTNNGDDYGTGNLWFEDGSNFAAGIGTPPNGTCVGIIILSWSGDQVAYQFGNAYDSFAHWYISAGDQYTLSVKGVQYSGTVSFSG